MTTKDYVIREPEKSESAAVATFLIEHHLPEAVVLKGFFAKNRDRLTGAEKKFLEEKWKNFVSDFPSLVAAHKDTNEIVGALLLVPIDNASNNVEKPPVERPQILEELDRVYELLHAEDKLNERFPSAKRLIKLRYMAVHTNHRCKGLAKALIKGSVEWAKKHGFDLVYGWFTMPAAKKAALGSEFTRLTNFDLNTVTNRDHSNILLDLSPNNVSSMMAVIIKA